MVLNPLDRVLLGAWLDGQTQSVHLLGASIGAWRMACACRPDAAAALREMAEDYIEQRYEHEPGRAPAPTHVSTVFSDALQRRFGGREAEVLSHPRRRLHVFTSRGKGLLARQGRVRTPLGYAGAFAANLLHRRAMGMILDRVVFSDTRDVLPLALQEYPTHRVPLNAQNLAASILASCSIPFWLDAVHDIAGAPRGAYWDGGITDYHLHLQYQCGPGPGLVLYPHFQQAVVPGWLDKGLKWRHKPTGFLDRMVVLAPDPAWVRSLPNGKLPDRNDFIRYGNDLRGRIKAWSTAAAESQRLADEFGEWLDGGCGALDVRPL